MSKVSEGIVTKVPDNMSGSNLPRENTLDWPDVIARTIERLTAKDLHVSYIFDNLEIEIPRSYGNNRDNMGHARWRLDGGMTISTDHNNLEKSNKKSGQD
jgi:hypothetical protein